MLKKVSRLLQVLGLVILLGFLAVPVRAEDDFPSAMFRAQVFEADTACEEADLKILSVSDNSFKLAVGDLIHINFAKTKGEELPCYQLEDIILGKVLFWQGCVNDSDCNDFYLVKNSSLDLRPRFKAKETKLIKLGAIGAVVLLILIIEIIRQHYKKKSQAQALELQAQVDYEPVLPYTSLESVPESKKGKAKSIHEIEIFKSPE